jgi:prefoldin subunit 5
MTAIRGDIKALKEYVERLNKSHAMVEKLVDRAAKVLPWGVEELHSRVEELRRMHDLMREALDLLVKKMRERTKT